MPTIPPTLRTKTYTLASRSAGPFEVGFRLFEATALAVYVNGLATTAYAVSATFLNGYDDAATITFAAAQTSGALIQMDGAMVPARKDDYLNGPQLESLVNIEMERLWAVISESRMLLKRAVLGLSDVGAGDAADAGGRRIKNLAAPVENNNALRLIDQQNVVAGGGNVPSPTGGQTGYLLRASGAGVFGWSTRVSIIGSALEAIRPITPAADKAVYFTSASAAALMDVTPFAKTILDDANRGAVRTTLGLGPLAAATQTIATSFPTNPDSTTIPTSQAVGSFSLGGGTLNFRREEFFAGTAIPAANLLTAAAIGAGTLATPTVPATNSVTPWGLSRGLGLRSSTTANSGYAISFPSIIAYSDGEIRFRCRLAIDSGLGTALIGLHDTLTSAAPTRGFFFELQIGASGLVARDGAGTSLATAALASGDNLILEILYNDVADTVRLVATRLDRLSRVWTPTTLIDVTVSTPTWISGNAFAPAVVATSPGTTAVNLLALYSRAFGVRNT